MKRTLAPKSDTPVAPSRSDAFRWLGLALLLIPQLTRASTTLTTLPAWDSDPLVYWFDAPAMSPAGSLLCDTVSLLGAAILLVLSPPPPRLRSQSLSFTLLAILGAAAVAYHAWIGGPYHGSLGNQRIGASWLSAIFGALALWHAAQDLRIRRVTVGILLGFVAVLAVYGAVQVFYQHGQDLKMFEADKDRILASRGWSPDSPMARAYERRLRQPEATGWFGLSNVYATFAAAAFVGGMGLLAHALCIRIAARNADPKVPQPGPPALAPTLTLALFSALSAMALCLARSKGGFLAAAGGAAALVAMVVIARRAANSSTPRPWRVLAGLLALSAILGPILLILIRGQIGERIGELLSLYFRWFYDQTAVRIFLDHPVAGVGPDGFQRAFTLLKPAECPEEVSSPHGIVFDYLADLGILGLAWIILLARFAWQATTQSIVTPDSRPPNPDSRLSRSSLRFLLALPAAVTILAAFQETPNITPEIALVRVVGLIAWCTGAWAIATTITGLRGTRIALAGAALALLAHAQIDLAASSVASAPLWGMLIALAAAPYPLPSVDALSDSRSRTSRQGRFPATLGSLAALLLAVATVWSEFNASRWTHTLELAANTVRPIAKFNDRLSTLSRPRAPGDEPDSIDAVVRDLAKELNRHVSSDRDSIVAAMVELDRKLLPSAALWLEQAWQIYRDDRRPLREASRLHARLAEAALLQSNQRIAITEFDRALEVLRLLPSPDTIPIAEPSASELHWLASILEERAARLKDPDALRRAAAARLEVVNLDPHNLDNAVHLFRDYQAAGDTAGVRHWAQRCLDLDKNARLDPEVRGLTAKDRAAIQQALSPPTSP